VVRANYEDIIGWEGSDMMLGEAKAGGGAPYTPYSYPGGGAKTMYADEEDDETEEDDSEQS
jgi:hypothetical protein